MGWESHWVFSWWNSPIVKFFRYDQMPLSGMKCRFQIWSRWWFQTFIIFTPTWGRFSIWLIFFRWVETTNQPLFEVWSSRGSHSRSLGCLQVSWDIRIKLPTRLPWAFFQWIGSTGYTPGAVISHRIRGFWCMIYLAKTHKNQLKNGGIGKTIHWSYAMLFLGVHVYDILFLCMCVCWDESFVFVRVVIFKEIRKNKTSKGSQVSTVGGSSTFKQKESEDYIS